MSKIGNELPPKPSIEVTQPEVNRAIEDLETVAAIMIHLGQRVPHDEIQPEWLRFFGRAIEQITEGLEERAP